MVRAVVVTHDRASNLLIYHVGRDVWVGARGAWVREKAG